MVMFKEREGLADELKRTAAAADCVDTLAIGGVRARTSSDRQISSPAMPHRLSGMTMSRVTNYEARTSQTIT